MAARPGAFNLITDVGGLTVGSAQDLEALTGVTVILPQGRCTAAVAVAGGGPGTRETDVLSPDNLVDTVDAIVLSGGSVYGLAAADAVAARLGATGRGFALRTDPGVPVSPIVPAAVLYDLANGGDKAWGEAPPYHRLGLAALDGCGETFELGKAGAGMGARAGAERGGLGSASIVTGDGYRVGAIAAVNAFGATRMPGAEAFWAWPYEQDREFGGGRPPANYALDLDDWGAAKASSGVSAGRTNTTLGCIAVNVSLTAGEARRVAKMAVSGLSRAIRPVFAPMDGDVVFALATGAREIEGPRPLVIARLGELAAACLARSVARGVHLAN
jgi:L-aminopeptidase/D-esterase-like protein